VAAFSATYSELFCSINVVLSCLANISWDIFWFRKKGGFEAVMLFVKYNWVVSILLKYWAQNSTFSNLRIQFSNWLLKNSNFSSFKVTNHLPCRYFLCKTWT
jgi:hypothetical protein